MEKSDTSLVPLWKQIFLWIVFLPAAWFGAFIAAYGIQNMMPPGETLEAEDIGLWRIAAGHAAWGVSFVWIGTHIVPKGKIPVSITLAGLTFLNFGLQAFLLQKDRNEIVWLLLIPPVVGVICAVACAANIIREQIKQSVINRSPKDIT
jgi:hypothetical protein